MAVVLADLLKEEHVTLELRANGREEALREIIDTMRGDTHVRDPEKFLREVLVREEEHSTLMGHGVALPHARTDLVQQIVLGIGRSRDGIVFGKKGERARLIFVVGVPTLMVTDYLVCVGALARLTNNAGTRAALLNAAAASEIVELLRAGSLVLE